MVGEHLDLSSFPDDDRPLPGEAAAVAGGSNGARPFLGVLFKCCGVYARLYVDGDRSAYTGHCPRCSRPVKVRIGPGGSDSRFFEAG